MIVYFTIGFYVFFLLLQEKNQKKQAKGALNARSSRTGAAPFGNPRHASPQALEHLNIDPVQAENVPIFCLKSASVNIGRAARASAAANSKTIRLFFRSLRCGQLWRCGRVGYIGAGGLDCGSKTYNAAPMPASLVTFLSGTRK